MKKRIGHYVRITEHDKEINKETDGLIDVVVSRDIWCSDRTVAEDFVTEIKNRTAILSGVYLGKF